MSSLAMPNPKQKPTTRLTLYEGSGEIPYCPLFSSPALIRLVEEQGEWCPRGYYIYGLIVAPNKKVGILQTQSIIGQTDDSLLLLGKTLLQWFLERNPSYTVSQIR